MADHHQESLLQGADAGTRHLIDPTTPTLGPFQSHSRTSRQAALDNYPRSGTQRWRIIEALAETPEGLTREQLSELLGIVLNSILPRVVELLNAGWIEESGGTRKTRQRCNAAVLVLTTRARTQQAQPVLESDGGR
jgi:hypothetical protein